MVANQGVLKSLTGTEQTRLNRTELYVQGLGDVSVRQALELAQNQDGPELLRQRGHDFAGDASQLQLLKRCCRTLMILVATLILYTLYFILVATLMTRYAGCLLTPPSCSRRAT